MISIIIENIINYKNMANIIIRNNWKWFLAEVEWYDNIYAYWSTEKEAKKELLWVVEMMTQYHLEEVKNNNEIKNNILANAILVI